MEIPYHEPRLSLSDGVLFIIFAYSSWDLISRWRAFSSCCYPIQAWLLTSFVCISSFRCLEYFGFMITGPSSVHSSPLQLAVEQRRERVAQSCSSRSVQQVASYVLFPFFVIVTLVGTYFSYQIHHRTPICLPDDIQPWFLYLWLLLCYAWCALQSILAALFFVSEIRLRKAQCAARLLISSDTSRFWGEDTQASLVEELVALNQFPSVSEPWRTNHFGLPPEKISSLPLRIYGESDPRAANRISREATAASSSYCCPHEFDAVPLAHPQCSICIENVLKGDEVRQLRCGHIFHRACLDLWLLRSAVCPNCKQSLVVNPEDGSEQDFELKLT